MSLLDLILLVVAGVSVFAGFRAGIARVAIGFLAAVLGVVFGFWFYGTPAAFVRPYIHSVTASNLIGFILVFWGCLLAGALAGHAFAKLFKWTGLAWIDKAAGAIFGLVRGALMDVALVAVLMAFTAKPLPNWMVDSKLLPYATGASGALAALAPNPIKTAFVETLNDIRAIWREQLRASRAKIEGVTNGAKKSSQEEKKR